MTHPSRKLGLKPRGFNPAVPHWSAYASATRQVVAPASCDHYVGMIPDSTVGCLGNDTWGDCAEAATYREVEIMSFGTTAIEAVPTTELALNLYSEVTQFDPNSGPSGANPTDNGTMLQDLLTYRVNTGILLPNGGDSRSKLIAFFEVDPRNINDVRLAINSGGIVQLGIDCYDSFMNVSDGGEWAPPGPDDQIDGGHAVPCGKYSPDGFTIKSWTMDIFMPLATWHSCVTECYCVVSPQWIEASGRTPLGLTEDQLRAAMRSLSR